MLDGTGLCRLKGKQEGLGTKTPRIELGDEYDLESKIRTFCIQVISKRQQQPLKNLRTDGIMKARVQPPVFFLVFLLLVYA